MNGPTLQALRAILLVSVPEAAAHIGGVAERTWRRWEDGGRAVPDDVASKVLALVARRLELLAELDAEALRQIAVSGAAQIQPPDAHAAIDQRIALSAAAEVAARHPGLVELLAPRSPMGGGET